MDANGTEEVPGEPPRLHQHTLPSPKIRILAHIPPICNLIPSEDGGGGEVRVNSFTSGSLSGLIAV